ncbi:hypothetical protein UY3_07036 [Chelonia mydas]|uniref:Uncharacterized protein n=1 Tax=Chelonia mydas TaxID=8469 RepID=M7BF35_CHEMY|nr:hypothetical protein UY3_07036 [Chelonia mydas]
MKSECRKTIDQNCTTGNPLTSCLFYKEFDLVLGSAPTGSSSIMVHDDLVSRYGSLLAPEPSMGANGSQQHILQGDHEVTLLLKPVPDQAMEQDQWQILGPRSEELFDVPPEKHPAAKPAANPEETEAAPEPVVEFNGSFTGMECGIRY